MASFSPYRSLRCRQPTGRSSPSSACSRRQRAQTGASGWSLISQPSTTGVHSSSSDVEGADQPGLALAALARAARRRARRAAPAPAPGSTVSSKPTMPSKRGPAGAQQVEKVLADLGLHRAVPCGRSRAARPGSWQWVGRARPRPYVGRSAVSQVGAPATVRMGGADERPTRRRRLRCGDGLAVDADLVRAAPDGDARRPGGPRRRRPRPRPRLRLRPRAGGRRRRAGAGRRAVRRGHGARLQRGRGDRWRPWRRAHLVGQRLAGRPARACRFARSTSRCCGPRTRSRSSGCPSAAPTTGSRPARRPVLLPGRRLRRAGQRQRCPACRSAAATRPGSRGAGSTRLLVDGVVHDRGAVGVVLGGRSPTGPS